MTFCHSKPNLNLAIRHFFMDVPYCHSNHFALVHVYNSRYSKWSMIYLNVPKKKYMHKNTWETYPYAAHMRLVKYACSLKSNHERVQLEEPVYTKVTLRLVSRLAWSMQPRSAFRLCQRAKPSLTP